MNAEEVIAAVKEALDRNQGVDIVYVHPDDRSPAFAMIVRVPSETQQRISDVPPTNAVELLNEACNRLMVAEGDQRYEDGNVRLAQKIERTLILPHDHIEPGMW